MRNIKITPYRINTHKINVTSRDSYKGSILSDRVLLKYLSWLINIFNIVFTFSYCETYPGHNLKFKDIKNFHNNFYFYIDYCYYLRPALFVKVVKKLVLK
tara:strand:+ start:242 stop:541 length:300 start_codon:yes stop_codon:yes gene_type:complete